MIILISQLVLFSSLLFLSILAASLQKPSYCAINSVINNDSMLKILLMHVEKDPKLRLLSKIFMKAFDGLCSEQLLLLDPRTRYLTHDNDGQAIISSHGTFLPKSVPLLKLYSSYLSCVYPLHKESFDDKFPVIEIPENSSKETVLNLRNQQRDVDFQRFKEILRLALEIGYNKPSNYEHPPMTFFCLYRLLRLVFSEQAFDGDFFTSIGFPLNKLLTDAASGKLPIPYGVEILSRFSINSDPKLIFNAVDCGISDLVKTILNNPYNDPLLLMNQRSEELFDPVHGAAIQGNVEIINLLIERGFPANNEGERGTRPIHLATMLGHYDAVVKLFEFDKDVATSALNRCAPIFEAAQRGHVDIVRFFLTQDSVDLSDNYEISRRLVKVSLNVIGNGVILGKLLVDSGKVQLTPDEIETIRLLNQ